MEEILYYIEGYAGAVSAMAAVGALILLARQLALSTKVASLSNNIALHEKITDYYNEFCDTLHLEIESKSEHTKSRRRLVDLLALFEQVSTLCRQKAIDTKRNKTIILLVIDLIDNIVDSDIANPVIMSSKIRDDIYEDTIWLIKKHRSRFRNYESVRLAFQIEPEKSWFVSWA